MTSRLVVPTLAHVPSINQSLGPFWVASCESRVKITLEEVEPVVMRRVEVPLAIRLDRLHLVLQAALGWTNSYLYELRARNTG
jgi:hypothetical protein